MPLELDTNTGAYYYVPPQPKPPPPASLDDPAMDLTTSRVSEADRINEETAYATNFRHNPEQEEGRGVAVDETV